LTLRDLEELPKYQEWQRAKADVQPKISQSLETAQSLDPVEQIHAGVGAIQTDVAAQLLDRLRSQSPAFFEQAVVDLLIAMGYGGTEGRGEPTQLTRDGGIDGVLDQDPLGLSKVYVQAKRYGAHNSVQRPEVHAFFGALDGNQADRGLFITTSTFSPGAVEFARATSKRIVLIDGPELAKLMIKYRVGVQVSDTFYAVEIDEDFFD